MAQNIIDTKIREAYDTEANWIKYNPVLLSGQLAYSSDKYGKYKIGNGASRWSQLQYATLGWGDITEKPSTFSPSTHTHNASQITELPTKLPNPNALTIKGNGGLNYTYDGSSEKVVNITAGNIGAAPASHTHGQYAPNGHTHTIASIERGTYNFEGRVSPVNRSLFNVARSCKTAFLPPESITVEYTRDNGASWLDYGFSDFNKRGLFSMNKASSAYLGKSTTEAKVGYGVRITIKATDRYVSFDTFYCWFSTAHTCTASIERSTKGEPDKFISVVNDVPVQGWSGANEIAFTTGTFGGGDGQLSNFATYRITFMIKSVNSNWVKSAVSVTDLRFYGDNCWGSANPMMENDNIYTWDALGNVSFPKDVKAANFIGDVQGNVQGKSTSSDYLHVYDTRNENPMPNDKGFRKQAISFDFKSSSTIGNPIANGYDFAGLMSFAPWSETSGGNGYQMAFGFNASDRTTPRLAIRTADLSATSWNSWYKIYTSADKPTLAELGAAASNHTHTFVEQAALADKATYINDVNDNRPISISYVNETSTSTRFPVWGDRNTMVSMSPESLRTSINAAKTDHTHPTGNATTLGLTKLYTKTGTAIDGTITQKAITEAIDSLKYLCAPIGHTHTVSQITDFPNIKAITNTQIDSLASL